MHDNEWHIPLAAFAALHTEPIDEADRLIASTGLEWPVRITSWTEVVE